MDRMKVCFQKKKKKKGRLTEFSPAFRSNSGKMEVKTKALYHSLRCRKANMDTAW